MNNALEAIRISKRFGDVVALQDVSMHLADGSFHALLGENGAGKSTLVKCIMGYYLPDEGELLMHNRQVSMRNPHEAQASGIGMVYQHFTLIPNMTVAENIVLSRNRLPAVIDWKKERAAIEKKMLDMPFSIPLDAPVHTLSAGEKQKVEIIKRLLQDIKILILDEPTSVLTPNEADEVLSRIKGMTGSGKLSVLMITHKFREVMRYADEVTVLRKGRSEGSSGIGDVNPQKLADKMIGGEYRPKPLQRTHAIQSAPVLRMRQLFADDDSGATVLNGVDLTVHSGEIVGIAGVSGNGQREWVELLAGQRPAKKGSIMLHDEEYRGRREQMRKHRFHVLPEEPLRNACVGKMSVAENLTFRRFDEAPYTVRKTWLNRFAMKKTAYDLIAQFRIRTSGPDQPIGQLSGGNVQRAVLARELAQDVEILVVANPCFGLDFGATAAVREHIMAARNRGAAVLLFSEDLDEILEMSDRLWVISNGRLVHETTPAQAQLSVIGGYMAGHAHDH